MPQSPLRIVIVGAGIGGLAAALRLSHAGHAVHVVEMHKTPGGKMRTLPSAAGPVDAGPTVLTMRPVFETLFSDVGERLEDHVKLTSLETLARHYWDDGTRLDLMTDQQQSLKNIAAVFGQRSANEFSAFSKRAARLFGAFDQPMMQAAQPSQMALTGVVLKSPMLIADMAPHRSLDTLLSSCFAEPKLRQLFGRYATYVGGAPGDVPALLSLIWAAEAQGVWTVAGGMHQFALALAKLAEVHGTTFEFDTEVTQIITQNGVVRGVKTQSEQHEADIVLFNGDPSALRLGLLGTNVRQTIETRAVTPRSLSAYVHGFAAAPSGLDLAHHTVFFGHSPNAEFDAISKGAMPQDATLYLCAQDHGTLPADDLQRFEIIMNASPTAGHTPEEKTQCQTLIFDRLAAFGLHFDKRPGPETLTTPQEFGRLFPASAGSLYGRSPQGLMAAFKRPTARTKIHGLYLCGGGTHPGAGVPMATLSGQHAAATIMRDHSSISMSRQTATPGGMLTGSAPAAPKQSLS